MTISQDEMITIYLEDEPDHAKTVSEKQLRANRENARKSTGPKTAEGKARSAQNARKHGILAATVAPIQDGSYAEEPEAFHEQIEAIVSSLGPRDAIEHDIATRIAGVCTGLQRLDRWSAAAISSKAVMHQSDFDAGIRTDLIVGKLSNTIQRLSMHLFGNPVKPNEYADFAWVVRTYGPEPGLQVTGLWDDDRSPSSSEEWEIAFRALMAHFWGTDEDAAINWVTDLGLEWSREFERVDRLEERIAANRILHGPVELQTKYANRLGHDLKRYLSIYQQLQSRALE